MALHWALIGKQEKAAQCIIEAGSSLSRRDANGYTPLHHALINNMLGTAKRLLSMGEVYLFEDKGAAVTIFSQVEQLSKYSVTALACIETFKQAGEEPVAMEIAG
jgi:ankyrin repeat protein